MPTREPDVTRLLLERCYNCPDARECPTVEDCVSCWEEDGPPSEEEETKQLLLRCAE